MGFAISSETVDRYKGYHYFVCAREASHKLPYVAVDRNDERVAYIEIRSKEVVFYLNTPKDVIEDEATLKTWIEKNHAAAVEIWNKLHPDYKV